MAHSAIELIAASASPLKPMVPTDSRSVRLLILLVAWRLKASGSSSRRMPAPSSSTAIRRTPPASNRTVTCVAPASSALSTNSRTTEAGRSTTSPAAIWLISASGSSRIGRRGEGDRAAFTALLSNPMEIITFAFDFILHVDKYLEAFVRSYGLWVYALLFLVIFVETGVVVMPFLPGDSLLFVVGAMCGVGLMSYPLAVGLLLGAAILGNQSNYTIGRYFGPKVFAWEDSRWFNKKAFDQAHAFYEKYGGITIVAARFMPFLRTFAPFVAGVAQMTRRRFMFFDVIGGTLWVVGIITIGYFFGNIPWVKEHLDKIIWTMILLPGLLVLAGAWRSRRAGA